MSSPPRIGPAATDTPEAAPQMPMAVFSLCGETNPRTIASAGHQQGAENALCRARRGDDTADGPIRPMFTEVAAKPIHADEEHPASGRICRQFAAEDQQGQANR